MACPSRERYNKSIAECVALHSTPPSVSITLKNRLDSCQHHPDPSLCQHLHIYTTRSLLLPIHASPQQVQALRSNQLPCLGQVHVTVGADVSPCMLPMSIEPTRTRAQSPPMSTKVKMDSPLVVATV
jgi:hypothetical protein